MLQIIDRETVLCYNILSFFNKIQEGAQMKKLTCLILALVLLVSASAALAEKKSVDGLSDRKIKIHSAKLNPSADEMIEQGISPTTGRNLDEIEWEDGFVGVAVTGQYQPIMVQGSNAGNGVEYNKVTGQYYKTAPVNGTYADVVYMAPQKRSGSETRMSMIFSDTIPDYVGFVRSTRLTHCRLRQEWECAFCTSGYASWDVPGEWKRLGVKNPEGAKEKDPGIVYVGDYPKVWKPYVWRVSGINDANSEVFMTADIVKNIVPKNHVPANHTWLFTDDIPAGGDKAEIVYVTFGNKTESDCRLEYSEDDNAYIRWCAVSKTEDVPYKDVKLVNPEIKQVTTGTGKKQKKIVVDDRVENEVFKFNNVIIQSVSFKWLSGLRPDPQLVGTGNADYFMCGMHYTGVWERKDDNSRTVFYGEDGREIELQRGKTLIILFDYTEKYNNKKSTANIQYE